MISETRKVDFVWKKIKGRIFTDNFPSDSGKTYYEEYPGTLVNPHATEVWIDDIPVPPPGSSTEIVEYYSDLVLTEDLSVVDHRSWFACETVGDPSTRIKGWVPPRFHQSYTVQIFDNNGTEITTTHESNWFFDYENGVLVFENDPTSYGLQLPIHLRGYVYKGQTLQSITEGNIGIKKFRWYFTENDYRANDNHVLFLRRDILKDPSKFKVYIETTEHSFVFHNQREYKSGSGLGNYYCQHIDINDYPIGSESGRPIYVEYTETYDDFTDYTIHLCRLDGMPIISKNIPLTINDEPNGPRYLANVPFLSGDYYTCRLEYVGFNDPTLVTTVYRYYPTHLYCPQFPKNYDFYTNMGLMLEIWSIKPRTTRPQRASYTHESYSHMILIDCAKVNMYALDNLKPGLYKFRFYNTTTKSYSKFFGSIRKFRIPIYTTDATVSKKEFKGFVYRTIAY